jgi:hypothetical protein
MTKRGSRAADERPDVRTRSGDTARHASARHAQLKGQPQLAFSNSHGKGNVQRALVRTGNVTEF